MNFMNINKEFVQATGNMIQQDAKRRNYGRNQHRQPKITLDQNSTLVVRRESFLKRLFKR